MASRRVLWTDTAQLDLQSIVGFIAVESSEDALRVLQRIERRCRTLEILPDRGRIVPELSAVGVLAYREIIERPWRIIYRADASRVFVIAVLDGRRNLATLLLERLAR
jgi:plasmid stabilization system protein ParE